MRIFNTYSRQIEEFIPLDAAEKTVRLYTCGPTVYNRSHIGNFRAYRFEDLLQRHLEARGYEVLRVMNLTDVDDKTIRNAQQSGQRLNDFTAIYKAESFSDRLHPANDRDDRATRARWDRVSSRGSIRLLSSLEVSRLRKASAP